MNKFWKVCFCTGFIGFGSVSTHVVEHHHWHKVIHSQPCLTASNKPEPAVIGDSKSDTFSNIQNQEPVDVPEPNQVILFGLAVLSVFGIHRYRKNSLQS